MGSGCHEPRAAVRAIGLGPCVPGDVAPEQTAAGGARTLPRDQRELFWRLWKGVEVCDCANEGRKAGSRRGETRGGGEVIRRNDTEGIGGEWGKGRIFGFESGAECAEGGETGLGARSRERLRKRVEEEGVRVRKRSGAGGRSVSAEVGLGKGDGEGGIGREVESWVSFSPVSKVSLESEINERAVGGWGFT